MEPRRPALAVALAALVLAAAAFAVFETGALGLFMRGDGSEDMTCAAPDRSMDETLSRMFALMSTDTSRLATCWTARKADPAVLSRYVTAGSPTTFVIENEHSRGRDGVLFAAVLISARWEGSPPLGWESSAMKVVVMRQHRDWSWTIDTIQPRTTQGMSDPHCGVCHR